MQKTYTIEREGQIDFFDNYGIPWDDEENAVLVDNTDGVYNGVLFEFKLSISNLNKVLFQAIKYLSRMRMQGESVPATIMLVSLNDTTVYVYSSEDYREEIQTVYVGAASKDNEGFVGGQYKEKLDYSGMIASDRVRQLLKDKPLPEKYMAVDIDENCIVGWAERYYREHPKASKGAFLDDAAGSQVHMPGEIREPKAFKHLIRPYVGKTNERFKYLMDKLNDRLSKKDLGAFYTPMPYAKKAAELVQMAVERVPDGNDYIILDRCAGTGNLEEALIGLHDKHGSPLIEHCIVSTYEYYEYKVLLERLGDRVRHIIPPTEANVVWDNGKVSNADAMSEEYINNAIIRQYVDDPACTVILFENPPYSEASTIQTNQKDKSFRTEWKNSYVINEMRKEHSGTVTNDLANLFIWSAFYFYIRQPGDCYVVFSPLKYWRYQGLVRKTFHGGYIFNRRHFHATNSAVACCYWGYESEDDDDLEIGFEMYDLTFDAISPDGDLVQVSTFGLYGQSGSKLMNRDGSFIWIGKVHKLLSSLYDKRRDPADAEGIYCDYTGVESHGKGVRIKPLYNKNMIGYLVAQTFGFENPRLKTNLFRIPLYNGNGFYLRKDNYMTKLPLFVACKYPVEDEWFRNGVVCTTADMGVAYEKDKGLLKSCLVYTCLSYYNKCLSFDGSDGRHYQNELCFDADTLASRDLAGMTLDDDEKALLRLWEKILGEARKMPGYNPAFTYGVYQVDRELNTYTEEGSGKAKKKHYDNPVLNGDLESLRKLLKDYYKSHITAKMFQYELLK